MRKILLLLAAVVAMLMGATSLAAAQPSEEDLALQAIVCASTEATLADLLSAQADVSAEAEANLNNYLDRVLGLDDPLNNGSAPLDAIQTELGCTEPTATPTPTPTETPEPTVTLTETPEPTVTPLPDLDDDSDGPSGVTRVPTGGVDTGDGSSLT